MIGKYGQSLFPRTTTTQLSMTKREEISEAVEYVRIPEETTETMDSAGSFNVSSSKWTKLKADESETPLRGSDVEREEQSAGSIGHRNISSGAYSFRCSLCDKSFTSRCNLSHHFRYTHFGDKSFECKMTFTLKVDLAKHMTCHAGEMRIECNVCQKKFTQHWRLTNHMLIHTGEKRFQCTVCNKKFLRKGDLKGHMNTHTRERRFECNVCNRVFSCNEHMKRHMIIHTMKTRFPCLGGGKQEHSTFDPHKHLKSESHYATTEETSTSGTLHNAVI